MKIRVDKLRKQLSLLQQVVPRKATLEVLANAMVRDGKIAATDMETAISLELPEAGTDTFLLPVKTVMEVLKYIPGDEMLTLELQPKPNSKSYFLKVSQQGGSATFEVGDAGDYPDIHIKDPRVTGELNGDRLVEALVEALPYCATDNNRPVLTGVTLYLGSVLQVAAADGFRMSFQSLNESYPAEEKIVIPARTVRVLEQLWRKAPPLVPLADNLFRQITQPRKLQLSLGNYTEREKPVPNAMEIRFGDVTLLCTLIEGNSPDHLKVLGGFSETMKVKFMALELSNAVRRVSGIAKTSSDIVKLQWTDSQMMVSSRSEATGEVQAVIPVEPGSIPGRVALNYRYLLGYLEGKDGMVTMGKGNGDFEPTLFHYQNRPIVAIMPMSIRWDEEQPVKPEPKAEVVATDPETEAEEVPDEVTEELYRELEEEIPPEGPDEPVAAEVVAAEATTVETSPDVPQPKRRGRRKKD